MKDYGQYCHSLVQFSGVQRGGGGGFVVVGGSVSGVKGVLALVRDFREVMLTQPPEQAHCAPSPQLNMSLRLSSHSPAGVCYLGRQSPGEKSNKEATATIMYYCYYYLLLLLLSTTYTIVYYCFYWLLLLVPVENCNKEAEENAIKGENKCWAGWRPLVVTDSDMTPAGRLGYRQI